MCFGRINRESEITTEPKHADLCTEKHTASCTVMGDPLCNCTPRVHANGGVKRTVSPVRYARDPEESSLNSVLT